MDDFGADVLDSGMTMKLGASDLPIQGDRGGDKEGEIDEGQYIHGSSL